MTFKYIYIISKNIKINNNRDNNIKLRPRVIANNNDNWQNKLETEFFVDFESLNTQFIHKEINLSNSKSITDYLFMIGVGYEENNTYKHKTFYADGV